MRYFLMGLLAVIAVSGLSVSACKAEEPVGAEAQQTDQDNQLEQADKAEKQEAYKNMELSAYEPNYEEIVYKDDRGESHVFKVEIASDPSAVQKGLMFRRQMDEDKGMLFVFSGQAERNFWMKNTFIPLDMFFIKADGTIHKIHKNAIPQDTTLISSDGPVQYVLELNAGMADKYGIEAGDRFEYDLFVNKLAE